MTLSYIWNESGRLLNDPNNQRWTTSVLTERANKAQKIIQGYSKAIKTTETLTPTANTQAVSLNANTIDINRVTITRLNGDQFPLEGTTVDDLDIDYPNWRNIDAGEPRTWFYDGVNQTLNLVPKPDSNSAFTNALSVEEIRKTTDMTSSTDVPFDSNAEMEPYEDAIVAWVVSKCWADDGNAEALGKAKFFRSGSMSQPGEFEKELMRINSQFNNPKVPSRIHWEKSGGRLNGWGPSKSDPLGTW